MKHEENGKGSAARPVQARVPTITYVFSDLTDAARAATELAARGFSGESALYRGEGGEYFLMITTAYREENGERKPSVSFLSEFGELENTENSILRLCERGERICPSHAVEILARL